MVGAIRLGVVAQCAVTTPTPSPMMNLAWSPGPCCGRTLTFPAQLLAAISILLVGGVPLAQGADATTGIVTGRVFNAATSSALSNVRISVVESKAEDVTDESGSYRIGGLATGVVHLKVTYIGFATETVAVNVTPGITIQRDIELKLERQSTSDKEETIELATYKVVADREMSTQAIAVNERRNAPSIKNVVSFDEYGDLGDENIGEFMRFLPGVAVNDSGLTASSLTLRGFPSNNTGIMMDGAEIASRNSGRSQSLLDVSMANISRVEVTKVPTPDQPASGLGGTINVITKTGFDVKKPVFNYQVYWMGFTTPPLGLRAGPKGQVSELSPHYQQPSFNLSYLVPLNRRLAFSFGLSRSWRIKQMERDSYTDTQSDWNLVSDFQRQSTWYSLRSLLRTWSGEMGLDWKISPNDTLGVTFQERLVSNFIMRNDFVAAYGTGATGNQYYTQGASTGVGTVSQASGTNRETATDTSHLTLRFKHRADNWRLDATVAWSRNYSILDDIDDGHFDTASIQIKSLILRGEGTGEDDALIPVRYIATKKDGTPVDIYNGANYSIASVTSSQFNVVTERYNGRIDLTRDFAARVPITIKVGTAVDRQTKDSVNHPLTWAFNPNGLTTDAARLAGNFDVFDADYNATAPTIFGHSTNWISLAKLYDLYKAQPSWFVLNDATTHQNWVTNSKYFKETISAAYIRGDVRLLHNRLWLIGGVRFEQTMDEGYGPLNDITATYQRDANGNVIYANGKPVQISTDALTLARLRYVRRGSHSRRIYDGYYPSFNATYNLTDNLLVRAGWAKTIGRPDISNIIPGATVGDPTATPPTITVNNVGLKPWTADGYDVSLEAYNLKGGNASVGFFQKNISNFFGSVTQQATPELLQQYGLPTDALYQSYYITTKSNVGDAVVKGYEFNYSQALKFLPYWARGFQVFLNYTKLQVAGNNYADFSGFAPMNVAGGINFVRGKYALKLNCTHQGETRGDAVAVSAANGIPENTYSYTAAKTRWNISAQYSFSKRVGVYFTMSDLFHGMTTLTKRYAADTPEYARNVRRQELGSAVTVGVKGQF